MPRPVAAVYVGAGHFEVVEDGSHVLVGAECSCEVAGLHISATFWREKEGQKKIVHNLYDLP